MPSKASTHQQRSSIYIQGEYPQNWIGIGMGSTFSPENLQYLLNQARIFTARCTYSASAVYCYRKLSVRPSVRLSVTLMYRGHIGWTSSELITRIISLGSSCSEPQHHQSSPKGTPLKFGWNRDGAVLSRKPAL